MGCVTITYDAPLKKYLMCVTDGGQHRLEIQSPTFWNPTPSPGPGGW